jgi:hypothetical protein
MNCRKLAIVLILIPLVTLPLAAQDERRAIQSPPVYVPNVSCPKPITQTVTAPPPSSPTLSATDFSGTLGNAVAGSTWNQTKADKGFGHSFTVPSPGKECCIWTRATLIVKVKALQAGTAGMTGASVNDWVQLVKNGASVAGTGQQPFSGGATVGQTATVTINVPQNVLNSGVISFYVQDDTAVQSAELRLEGCCIR